MMNPERSPKAIEERQYRQNILNNLMRKALIRKKYNRDKHFSIVQYVIGRYNPHTGTYQYMGEYDWVENLNDADPKSTPNNFIIPKTPKGCKYSISKVFVKIISIYQYNNPEHVKNNIYKITLTNPNHYEKLSAIINNI